LDQLEEDIEDTRQMIEQGQLAIDRSNPSVKSEYIFSEGESIMNYPNPGNPATTVKYRLSKPGQVKVCVYNIWGQVVKVLVDEVKEKGLYEVVWDGRNNHNFPISTGLYLIQLQTTENILTHKVTILK